MNTAWIGAVVELRVKVDAWGADLAMPWPGQPVIGVLGEMFARLDVVVLGGDHVGVVAVGSYILVDFADHRGATGNP